MAQAISRTTATTAIRMNRGCRELLTQARDSLRGRAESELLRNALGALTPIGGFGHQRVEHVQAGHDGFRLWECVFRFHSPDDGEPEVARHVFDEPVFSRRHYGRLHHDRHPDVRGPSDLESEELAGRRHDRERSSGEIDRSADDQGSSPKRRLQYPSLMTAIG